MTLRQSIAGFALLAAVSLPCHAEPASGDPEPRLMGIVVAGALRQAIFTDPAGGGSQIVRVGDVIGGYRVYVITPREVGLEGADGRRLVQPGSDPATRSRFTAVTPLIDPYRREAQFENDQ